MRIRKHAKISPLVYTTSSLNQATVIQTHVCQLNQSPWDVMNFSSPDNSETPPPPPPPPPLLQADSYMVIGTFADCIAADQSAQSSMKFEAGNEMQKWDHDVGNNRYGNGGTEMEQENDNDEEEEIINLCCKSDGKGWQCKRKAKEGHSLCEHHSSSLSHQVNNNKTSNSVGKKSEKEKSSENRRRPRHKKTSTSTSSSNPNEYYYYSGFGPRWGKKRGAAAAATKAVAYTSSGGSEISRNDVELVGVSNSNSQTYRSNGINNNNVSESFQFSRSSRMDMDIEGFDYIEEDDDDYDDDEEEDEEDDEIGQTEKKRARKPIKARSLKSLM